jgi:hypothetical protein
MARRRRRTRFRTTAPPSRLVVIKPKPEGLGQGFVICEVTEHQKPALERLSLERGPAGNRIRLVIRLERGSFMIPESQGSGNTEEASMEASGGESRLLAVLDGMALVMDLSPLGNEALTTFLAAALDEVAPGFGGHTGTEAVLAFAGALGGLIGPFHLFRLKMLPKPKSS